MQYNYPPNYQNTYNPNDNKILSSNPAINIVKTVGSSVSFLIAVIAFTLTIIIKLIQIFSSANYTDILSTLPNYIDNEIVYELSGYLNTINSASIISSIIALIPVVLIVLGLWMFYASCCNKNFNSVSTSGLTIIKVVTLVQLIILCIAFVLLEGVIILMISSVSSLPFSTEQSNAALSLFGFLFIILFAAIFTFVIIYNLKIMKTIKCVKNTVRNGTPFYKVSTFLAVFNFISSFFIVLSFFGSLTSGLILQALNDAFTATYLIIFSIGIFTYRKKMLVLDSQYKQQAIYNNPMYNNQQYNNNYVPQFNQPVNNQPINNQNNLYR